jgi:hypothetical protein
MKRFNWFVKVFLYKLLTKMYYIWLFTLSLKEEYKVQ